jgi:hypothetical protein
VIRGAAAWKLLGVKSTRDRKAIKRGYSDKLKSIDVDADPQAFIALRQAMEWALERADAPERYAQAYDDDAAEVDSEHDEGGFDYGQSPAVFATPGGINLDKDTAPRQGNDLYFRDETYQPAKSAWREKLRALTALLNGKDEPGDHEIQRATHDLLNDPALDMIDVSESVDDALSKLVLGGGMRVVPMAQIASPHFGWMKTGGSVHDAPIAVAVRARLATLSFIINAQLPGSALSGAWDFLSNPPTFIGKIKSAFIATSIDTLLQRVRIDDPDSEDLFDPATLDWWDMRPMRIARRTQFAFTLLVMIPLLSALFVQLAKERPEFVDYVFAFIGSLPLWWAYVRIGRWWRERMDDAEYRDQETPAELVSFALILLMPIVAAIVPPSVWVAIIISLVTAAATIATRVQHYPSYMTFADRWNVRRYPLAAAFMIPFAVIYGVEPMLFQLTVTTYAAVWLTITHGGHLRYLIEKLGTRARSAVQGMTLVAAIATITGAAVLYETPYLTMFVGVIITLTLLQFLAVEETFFSLRFGIWSWIWFGVIGWRALAFLAVGFPLVLLVITVWRMGRALMARP